jgi:hypothetical protein
MNLTMNFKTQEGFTLENCYIIISSIVVLPETSMISTNWYAIKEDLEEGRSPFSQIAYHIPTSIFDPGPIYNIAYNHLLTLPEFENAQLVPDAV